MKNLITRSQAGMTLIEVLTALSLVTIAVFSAVHLTLIAQNKHLEGRRYSTSAMIADSFMESLQSMSSGNARLAIGDHQVFFDNNGKEANAGPYTVDWTISHVTGVVGMVRIDLRVSWDSMGFERNVRIASFRKGP